MASQMPVSNRLVGTGPLQHLKQANCHPARPSRIQIINSLPMHFRFFIAILFLCSCSGVGNAGNRFSQASSSLAAFDGHLAGFDHGEWGGKLVFISSKGKEVELLDKNVSGIFRVPSGVVVLTGLAHLSLNSGEVYAVAQNSDKSISTRLLITLPGAPFNPIQTADGGVLFGVLNGGYATEDHLIRPLFKCYVLTSTSRLEPASCTNGLESEH